MSNCDVCGRCVLRGKMEGYGKKSGPHFSDRSYYDSIRVSVVKLHFWRLCLFLALPVVLSTGWKSVPAGVMLVNFFVWFCFCSTRTGNGNLS